MRHPLRRSRHRLAFALLAAITALAVGACDDSIPDADGAGTSTASASATAPAATSTEGTPTATVSTETPAPTATSQEATSETTPTAQERLRSHLLSSLTTGVDPTAVRDALDAIEVLAIPLPNPDRDLWAAVTSGAGIWELSDDSVHVAAIYELHANDTWVEVANAPLESAPTFAELELVLEEHAGAAWIAVHGLTGAHSGTFELLRFDGVELALALWWFSPTPGAASIADLNGDGLPEVVLNATDPYVYCYACGVRAWDELIYRWSNGELMEVPIASVSHSQQLVVDLTAQAAIYAHADLWRRARDTVQIAVQAAPDSEDVRWLDIAISRVAEARLDEAGAEQQPLMTNVLAGEYAAAVDLMRPHPPEEALSATGPLITGTVAEDGYAETTGEWLVEYATRAVEAEPSLAPAYAVRAYGLLLLDPDDWGGALREMSAALDLAPDDRFYQGAVDYLLQQTGGIVR